MSQIPSSLRSVAIETAYQTAKDDGTVLTLAEEPTLLEWEHWRVVKNRYPYDVAYSTHHMLLPKREVSDWGLLTHEEQDEFWHLIEAYVEQYYDLWFVNTKKKKSVLSHFHVHLANYYSQRNDTK